MAWELGLFPPPIIPWAPPPLFWELVADGQSWERVDSYEPLRLEAAVPVIDPERVLLWRAARVSDGILAVVVVVVVVVVVLFRLAVVVEICPKEG